MMQLDKEMIQSGEMSERYLNGQLTPEEAAAFEDYLMDHPDLVAQLELDSVFKATLPEVQLSEPQQSKPQKPKQGFRSWFSWPTHPVITAAATLGVCVLILPLIYPSASPPDYPVLVNMEQVVLAPMRGATDTNRAVITTKPGDHYFEVVVETSDDSALAYRVDVVRESDGLPVVPRQTFKLHHSGELKLALPVDRFAPGNYRLTATPDTQAGKPDIFFFKVRHGGP